MRPPSAPGRSLPSEACGALGCKPGPWRVTTPEPRKLLKSQKASEPMSRGRVRGNSRLRMQFCEGAGIGVDGIRIMAGQLGGGRRAPQASRVRRGVNGDGQPQSSPATRRGQVSVKTGARQTRELSVVTPEMRRGCRGGAGASGPSNEKGPELSLRADIEGD